MTPISPLVLDVMDKFSRQEAPPSGVVVPELDASKQASTVSTVHYGRTPEEIQADLAAIEPKTSWPAFPECVCILGGVNCGICARAAALMARKEQSQAARSQQPDADAHDARLHENKELLAAAAYDKRVMPGGPVEIEVKGRKVLEGVSQEQLRQHNDQHRQRFIDAQRPIGAPMPRDTPAADYMALAAAHSVNQPARFYGSEFPPITIALRLDTRHNAVLEGLADEQGMTKEQVMRQALRIYQMIHTRAKEGKALAFTKDGVVMPEVVGLPWL